jgi:hypothetical protein
MSDTYQVDSHRINGIVNFMREATSIIDPEEALAQSGMTDINRFTESQLTYLLVQSGIKNHRIKELFYALNNMDTYDIRIINFTEKVFEDFTLIAGGLYYAKAIRRLIKKSDIIIIQNILTPDGYNFICQFPNDKACIEDYPLTMDFEKHFKAIGYHILQVYFSSLKPIINHFLQNKHTFSIPELDIKHLRISNEYALELAIKTRNFIIEELE